MRKILLVAISCILLFAGCATPSSDLLIDLQLDMGNIQNSYFNWVYDDVETNDSFDVVSGASVAQSTAGFNVAFLDSTQTSKFTLPIGLRSLVLYPVSSEALIANDDFAITGADGNFVITFVHRADAYQITATNGKMDLATSFKIAAGVCNYADGTFSIKDEFLTAGGNALQMADLDWAKIPLITDSAAVEAFRNFSGKLDASYMNKVLDIKGTLIEMKK